MNKLVLSGIFAFYLLTASLAVAETQYFLHLRSKDGLKTGQNYYSRDYNFYQNLQRSGSELIVNLKPQDPESENSADLPEIVISRLSGLPLEVEKFEAEYLQSELTQDNDIVSIQASNFYCNSGEINWDQVNISRLEVDSNSPDQLQAFKVDFSKGCGQNRDEIRDYISGSLLIYEGLAAAQGLEKNVELNIVGADGQVNSDNYTDQTHNLWFEQSAVFENYLELNASSKNSPFYDGGGILSLNTDQIPLQSPLSAVRLESFSENHGDALLDVNYCPNQAIIRVAITNIENEYGTFGRYGENVDRIKSISLEYTSHCWSSNGGNLPYIVNSDAPELVAFGRVKFNILPEKYYTAINELAELKAENNYLKEQNVMLGNENFKLNDVLSSKILELQALKAELEVVRVENGKLKQQNVLLAQDLDGRVKEINTIKLALKRLAPKLNSLSVTYCKKNLTCRRAFAQVANELTKLSQP